MWSTSCGFISFDVLFARHVIFEKHPLTIFQTCQIKRVIIIANWDLQHMLNLHVNIEKWLKFAINNVFRRCCSDGRNISSSYYAYSDAYHIKLMRNNVHGGNWYSESNHWLTLSTFSERQVDYVHYYVFKFPHKRLSRIWLFLSCSNKHIRKRKNCSQRNATKSRLKMNPMRRYMPDKFRTIFWWIFIHWTLMSSVYETSNSSYCWAVRSQLLGRKEKNDQMRWTYANGKTATANNEFHAGSRYNIIDANIITNNSCVLRKCFSFASTNNRVMRRYEKTHRASTACRCVFPMCASVAIYALLIFHLVVYLLLFLGCFRHYFPVYLDILVALFLFLVHVFFPHMFSILFCWSKKKPLSNEDYFNYLFCNKERKIRMLFSNWLAFKPRFVVLIYSIRLDNFSSALALNWTAAKNVDVVCISTIIRWCWAGCAWSKQFRI